MPAFADGQDYADRPQPGENFTHFFQRITRGGTFPGIVLDAPAEFQAAFLPEIWRPTWQGRLDRVQRRLRDQGVDVWLDWYASSKPVSILTGTNAASAALDTAYEQSVRELARCVNHCREFALLSSANWTETTTEERQALAWAYVTKAKIFGGRTLLEFLADQHALRSGDALPRIDFRLLNSADFAAAVKQLGWNGDIYFRGITAPSPGDPKIFWILLNDDLMRQMTPFKSPLLQMLEYVGILVHESSHVLQNMRAEKRGLDLSINSSEGILLVEGEAEWLAERAMTLAGSAQDYPSPLPLFAAEDASEIVNRPGQNVQGNLFPYTVGVPFAAALYDLSSADERLRAGVLDVIAGVTSLADFLKTVSPNVRVRTASSLAQ